MIHERVFVKAELFWVGAEAGERENSGVWFGEGSTVAADTFSLSDFGRA